jgi:polysaccharide deacetylase family protein (PEP-CTERM system associated)
MNPSLLLSFDLEDFNQIVQRNLGLEGWDARRPPLERQMEAVFGLLDELGVKATFFVLGMTIRHYPEIAQEIGSRGDEIACHGYGHRVVYRQTPLQFRRDLESSLELIEGLTGRRPVGYRAPLFSINRDTVWALEELAELGFRYDSSQYESRKIPARLPSPDGGPYRLQLPSGRELWELPVAAWRRGRTAVPMGGGSYWRVFPATLLRRALRTVSERDPSPALYFHPYEFDPQRLRVILPPSPSPRQRLGALRMSLISNPGRKRIPDRIREIAKHHRLTSYEQGLAEIGEDGRARPGALSGRGVRV